jgi:hypothetical protein
MNFLTVLKCVFLSMRRIVKWYLDEIYSVIDTFIDQQPSGFFVQGDTRFKS